MPLLYERLRTYLLDEIRSGRLAPGDRVPSELALADQFSVSRITSKKALETLEHDGLIVRFRGKGSFVADGHGGVVTPSPSVNGNAAGQLPARKKLAVPTIGFIIPNISDVFGTHMLGAIEERCSDLGYSLVLKRTYGRREIEDASIARFVELGVGGLIVFPIHGEFYNDTLLRIVLDGYPVVLVDRYLKGIAVNSVGTDNYEACKNLTRLHIESGHQKIAFFSLPPERTSSIEDRRRGFGAALREADLPYDHANLNMNLSCTMPSGEILAEQIASDKQRINQYLDANPDFTAFVACEYTIAVILEQVLLERGRSDLATNISCFDAPRSPLDPVRFTHALQDEYAIGQTAVDLLTGQATNPNRTSRMTVPYTIVRKG